MKVSDEFAERFVRNFCTLHWGEKFTPTIIMVANAKSALEHTLKTEDLTTNITLSSKVN